MDFLPNSTWHINPIALFGIILLLGLLGGEIARFTRFLPRISGYIIVGFLVGPNGCNMVTESVLSDVKIFVDVASGLILFDLGRHLDFKWLRHDSGLLRMSITESSLTFALVFFVLSFSNVPSLLSALGATIAIATSPGIIMMVAHDSLAKGPVARRALILTSLNNLVSLTLFTLFLALTQLKNSTLLMISEHVIYRLFGSIILGIFIFLVTIIFSYLIGKSKKNQFILFIGAVTLGIGLAVSLKLSSMLTLFTLGVAARNFDYRHKLTEVDFGWLARVFFVLLFVVTGVSLRLEGLWQMTAIVFAFIVVKCFAKMAGVWLFASQCRLTSQQTWALGLALCPMAEVAIGMSNRLVEFNVDFSNQLIIIITASIAIFNIFGPITTQMALMKTSEEYQPIPQTLGV